MPQSRQRLAPFSLRLTPEERQQLEKAAAGQSMAAYVKSRLFSRKGASIAPRGHFPTKDRKALAALLALLGQSDMAANLRELSRLARAGALPITPESESTLRKACRDIADIKSMLIRALGLKP